MVPSGFVTLRTLPLLPNGKVDRRGLPAPEGRPDVGRYVTPRTPTEEALAGIWKDLLNLDRVGVDDNFFDLGGHSLLLVRIHAAVQKKLNLNVPITALLRYPTIYALSQYVDKQAKLDAGVQQGLRRAQTRHARNRAEATSGAPA
jgi:acyl carrier protein